MDIAGFKSPRFRGLIAFIIVFTVILFFVYSYGKSVRELGFIDNTPVARLADNRQVFDIQPAKEDGVIRYVFFDLGANKGDSLSNFLGLESSGGGGNLHNLFPPGLIANNNWIIHAYEANPFFDDRLAKLKAKVPKKHTLYMNNGTAAWIYDGDIEFYLDKFAEYADSLGSSLKKEHKDVIRSNFFKIKVPCHHIARILSQYDQNDVIIMKVDIEGAEYDLFLDFMKYNVLKLIDYFAIEYHEFLKTFKTPEEVFDKIIETYGIKKMGWI